MTLSLTFHVTGAGPVQMGTVAIINGESVPAQITGWTVDLASDQCVGIKLNYSSPADIAEAQAKFIVGTDLVWTF